MERTFAKLSISNKRVGVWLGLGLLLLAVCALRAVPAHAATPLLPNLVADPPDTQSIATDTSTGTPRLLLRFDGYIHNKGPGAVDFRGSREAPKVSAKTLEEAERAHSKEESLPQKTEEELAVPPMKAFQRLFTTTSEETNRERAHVEEPSSAELIYSSADGHHHWHLQRVAKYSLWNSSKTAEVAPAMKVGFCLDDSQHVETSVGPASPVYSDATGRAFCQKYEPYATSLFEGISPGWRDVYDSSLAFQWVEVSNVLPGEYWLREDVNPLGVVKETAEANVPVYSTTATIIPGFDALPQAVTTPAATAKAITLTSKAFNDTAKPTYKVVSAPAHGTLGAISEGHVTYTPSAGFSGTDSFTFSAQDPSSPFPEHPATATVSIEVGESTAPSVSIEGAPASMQAGSSVQLTAKVANDSPEVTWGSSAGSITQAGRYTAPAEVPAGGSVTITATTSKGAKASKTIEITPAAGTKGLLAGDPTATYSVGDQTTAGREEAFQFTAKTTGTVEEMLFRTNATANTGVTGLVLAVFAENGGKPGEVLGRATASGTPAVSSWIKATGLSVPVTAGTKYWLVALPVGSGVLHYNAAVTSGGTGNVESTVGGLANATAESSWESYNQGPVGFQANGTVAGPPVPTVTIEGAPASMTTGSSVQLTAKVTNDSPEVTWGASAGSITSAGRYTAPTEVPAGGKVTVTATTSKGATTSKTIEITTPTPSVTIEGAPTSMQVGTNVQLTAKVTNDSPEVEWSATGGSITPTGSYTAPAEVPAGGKVTVSVKTSKGATASKSIEITAPAPSVTIEGAPASMTTGSSVQLTAKVTNDSPEVTWSATAGSITSAGKYTAPAEVPAGGKVTVSVKTSKGATASKSIEITPAAGTKGLLAGDATATYTVGDQTTAGREEAFQFTAKSTGTVEEMLFRTNGTANTGVTGLVLAVFAENGGKPGTVLGKGTASGTPAVSSWIKVTGLSVAVTSGTKYWLVALPVGSGLLHYNAAVTSKGTGNVESTTGGLSAATAESSWETYNQGPVGFQANGTLSVEGAASTESVESAAREAHAVIASAIATAARIDSAQPASHGERAARKPHLGRIALAGAPAAMFAGTSIQLSALLAGPHGALIWSASAGTIGPGGLFTAPALEHARTVTIHAGAAGARGESLRIRVRPVPVEAAAPAAAALSPARPGPGGRARGADLTPLQAMLFNDEVVLTAGAQQAGMVTIVARADGKLLGSCSTPTPGGVTVTCRLSMHGAPRDAILDASARLLVGHHVLARRTVSGAAVPAMKMASLLPAATGSSQSALAYLCSPALRRGGPGAIS